MLLLGLSYKHYAPPEHGKFRRFEESPVTLDKVSRRQFMQAGGIGLLGVFAARANAMVRPGS